MTLSVVSQKKNAKKFIKESKFKKISISQINKKIKKLKMIGRSELIKGDITKTAEQYVKKNKGFKISLLNMDLDTYEGTKSALKNFYPSITKGGIILLDEYGKRGWGETDAVDEFLKQHPKLNVNTVKFSDQPTSYIKKI